MFRIGSITQTFTSLAVLKLRDAGKLALDDPAVRYLPELAAVKYPTGDSPPITIRPWLRSACSRSASSVISPDGPGRKDEALVKIATEICKASRITTEGVLNPTNPPRKVSVGQATEKPV